MMQLTLRAPFRLVLTILVSLSAAGMLTGCNQAILSGTHSASSATPVSPTDSIATATVATSPGLTIPSNFMGLSHEWGDTMKMLGYSKVGVNTIYRQLLTNLTAYGSAPIDIRIGGNSTDTTGEPSGDRVKPMAELATAMNMHFSLGVNLGSDNVSLATDQARFYVARMPAGSLEALEVGNEPDEYPKRGMRPAAYSVQDYFNDFDQWKNAIQPLLPSGTKLLGASWASGNLMQSSISTYENNEASALQAFSAHLYGGSPDGAATDYLLQPSTAASGPRYLASAVATTHSHGIAFRVGETNSLYDVGVHGISDAFGAALWSVDWMFECASIGVDGVNWETSTGNYYAPFSFTTSTVNGTTSYALQSVGPLYYGLLFFQAATANGARLLPVALSTQANLKVWATVDGSGVTRGVIINKDETAQGPVAISMPGYSQVSVSRLVAPSYTSLAGITFAGRTFDGSPDGTLQGSRISETIHAVNGVFEVPMPVTSAALLVFSN